MTQESKAPVLDVRGEICPYPMLRTTRELDNVRPGAPELLVWTDHPPALATIPPEAFKRGYGCEISERRAGEWEIHIFNAEAAADK